MERIPTIRNVAEQQQRLLQQQHLTQSQVRLMRVLELPLQDLEAAVAAEIDENPALCPLTGADAESAQESYGVPLKNVQDSTSERSEERALDEAAYDSEDAVDEDLDDDEQARFDELAAVLRNIGQDDDMDEPRSRYVDWAAADDDTLIHTLTEQTALLDLDEKQREVMDYVLGALDDDGLLRRDVAIMVEELYVYNGISVTAEEMQCVINLLKMLDPPGIGAQSLQECLLIQVERRRKTVVTTMMKRILRDYFEDFINGCWNSIYENIHEDKQLIDEAFGEIRKLNPRPGAGLGHEENESAQQITPDFFVENDDGHISYSLNMGKVPPLALADDFEDLIRKFESVDRDKLRKQEFDALQYARSRVARAQSYIVLLQLRFRTLSLLMKTIIERQHDFFISGDDADLKPLLMKDVAQTMNYDVSTISRCCKDKYVQTEWGVFPMKHFFMVSYAADESSNDFTLRQLLDAIRELINGEDKSAPLSDAKLTKMLAQKGLVSARRTVTKYRERLGYKTAKERRQ